MNAGSRAAVRRPIAALAGSMALLLAGPLSAQYLSQNYVVNGDFDTGIEGWSTSVAAVSWDAGIGSPQTGSMRQQYVVVGQNLTRAWQCFPWPPAEPGPYRLSARARYLYQVRVFTYANPDCSGPQESVSAQFASALENDWERVQTVPFEPSGAAASLRIELRAGPSLRSDFDSVEFGPLRNYMTVSGGAGNDYQASVAVPWAQPDARVVVFERLGAGASGDLFVTRSDDGGGTWTAPVPVVATAGNERHAALVQTGADAWSLFHLSNASGSFRIHRATSSDGASFSASVPVDLGWPAGSNQINPHVIRTPDGALTMTYHLLGGASFIARSTDDGASWDTLRTQVSPDNAALPRIAHRASDDTWLLAYQTGSNPVTLWVKTSADPYDWSAPARQLTLDGNNHDAFPMVIDDDSFVIAWARVANGAFQIFSTRSLDGVTWETRFQHTDRAGLANVQPHALPGTAPGTIELYWGAAQVPGDGNYDIARLPAAGVTDPLFADGFENP
jgi:hypothetical protein